jgi:hypothetical protein
MIQQRKKPAQRAFHGLAGSPLAAAKPAQAPELSPEFPITVVPPHRADAKLVSRSAVRQDIRDKIEDSLASTPNVVGVPRPLLIEADTSEGTKTVRTTSDDIDSAVDDAAEDITRGTDPKRTSHRLLATQKTKKQPAYLKTVAQPVIPSTDPDAPYGRDDNDRPIGVPVGRPYVKPVQTGAVEHIDRRLVCNCGETLCMYCHPENIVKSDVLGSITRCEHDRTWKYCLLCNRTAKPRIEGFDTWVANILQGRLTAVAVTESKKFLYWPEILGITRGQLIGLLELDVTIEPRLVRKTVLKSRVPIETTVARLLLIPKQIDKRKKLIRNAERLIESWSVRVMKLRRADEDVLHRQTREQFKRKERARIIRSKEKISELRRQYAGFDNVQQRLAAWGAPSDYESVATTEDGPIRFEDKFEFRRPADDGGRLTVGDYRRVVDMYDFVLKDASQRIRSYPVIDRWRYFENEIVLQGIGRGIIRPSEQVLAEHPWLSKIGPPVDADGDDPAQDDAENALIIKTGGAQIGGGIYGTKGGKLKSFEYYDKNTRRGNDAPSVPYGGERPHNWLCGMDSGDLDERRGDE